MSDERQLVIILLEERRKDEKARKDRLKSLDIFRGLIITFMILVNTQAFFESSFGIFRESPWDGLSPADCIFPGFLFIMGCAISFSFYHMREHSKLRIIFRIFLRALILVLLGLVLNYLFKFQFTWETFDTMRIPSVLGRLGICYLIISIVCLPHYIVGLVITLAFLGLYAYFTHYFNVPVGDCGKGKLTPICFAGGYIDEEVFTRFHMIYPTDPEGIISTFSALFTVFSGYTFSLIMQKVNVMPDTSLNMKYAKIALRWGILIIINCAISFLFYYALAIPFNKKMYSLSFTCIQTAIHGLLLLLLLLLIDWTQKAFIAKIFSFFTWLGVNSLLIYIGHQLLNVIMHEIPVNNSQKLDYYLFINLSHLLNNANVGNLLYSIIHWIIWVAIAGILHRFGLILKL